VEGKANNVINYQQVAASSDVQGVIRERASLITTPITPSQIDEILLQDPGFRHCAAKVWALSMRGTTSGEVGLVVWRSGGQLFCGPHSSVVNGDRLALTVPNNSIAIVHTHPYTDRPTPSRGDAEAAKRIGIPNYVLHRLGVWRVASDGRQVDQVAGPEYTSGL
jgi:hypothetical protein